MSQRRHVAALPQFDREPLTIAAPPLPDASFVQQAEVLAQAVPPASSLESGSAVVLLAHRPASGLVGRFLRRPAVPRAVRAGALLAQGYTEIGGTGADEGPVWGVAGNGVARSGVARLT